MVVPLELLFYFSGRAKPHTKPVITLEILDVTMEAFVSVLNGLPRHSFTDCAESIFRLFNFISCSKGGFLFYFILFFGTLQNEVSGGPLLLIISL